MSVGALAKGQRLRSLSSHKALSGPGERPCHGQAVVRHGSTTLLGSRSGPLPPG